MLPFRAQYLPTNTINEDSNESLRAEKDAGDKEGKKWTSKYLFHIPLKKGRRTKQKKGVNIKDINGVENDGDGVEDIMMNQGTQEMEDDTVDRMIASQANYNNNK